MFNSQYQPVFFFIIIQSTQCRFVSQDDNKTRWPKPLTTQCTLSHLHEHIFGGKILFWGPPDLPDAFEESLGHEAK